MVTPGSPRVNAVTAPAARVFGATGGVASKQALRESSRIAPAVVGEREGQRDDMSAPRLMGWSDEPPGTDLPTGGGACM